MDVENLLVKASDNLFVRRAFGTAYEKDGILIIPVAIVAGGGGGTARTRHGNSAAHPSGPPEEDPAPHDSAPHDSAPHAMIVVVASLSLVRVLARTWIHRRRHHGQP